jgi:ribulose-phosphate 3-epimerase
MGQIRITPSILNADQDNLDIEIGKIAKSADLLHLDIMDNKFVPNLTWDFAAAERIIRNSPIPVDAHLMIEDPDVQAISYAEVGCASVTIHYEATLKAKQTLTAIRRAGARAAIAIKPRTDFSVLIDLKDHLDMVLIMTVEPGFGGQKFMSDMMEKVRSARNLIGDSDIWLQVDGGITVDTISIAKEAGADTFVAGSAVFKAEDPADMVQRLRNIASGK